jgi:dipeptidyl aminopeptidase/acylaminoacyl peptidase
MAANRPPTATLALLALHLLAGPAPAQQPQGPALEDLFRVAALGDPQLSPDGGRVVYTVRTAELERNRTTTNLWMVPAAGGEAVQLTRSVRNDTRPRWSPDGRHLAFLSAREPEGERATGSDLYRMAVAGGEPERLYDHPTAITAFEWSPDGRWIAFLAADEAPGSSEERRRRGRDIELEDVPGDHTHLWVLDVEGRTTRRLTGEREFSVRSLAWSPDSRRIAFAASALPTIVDAWQTHLWLVDAQAPGAAARRLTAGPGPESDPRWTPDGRHVVYAGNPTGGFRLGHSRVFRIPAEGGEPEDISPRQDLDPSGYTFTPDGRAAFFQATAGTTTALYYMPLATREAVRLTPEDGVYGSASFAANARRVALLHQSPERPEELYVADLAAAPRALALASPTRVTAHNAALAPLAVGRTEVLRWRSADGRPIEGVLVYPQGWTAGAPPGPLVVRIHGGPAGVYLQNFQAGSHNANAQVYAADGYAMLMPNPRGSIGYGDQFQRDVIEDWGGLDFQDIMTGVDTLVARGVAHPDSLGVMGWSYGGYMTAWTVTQTDRFRGAVVGAGITEVVSMWGTQDIIHTFEGYFGADHPFTEGRWDVYQRSSPLAFVRNARTPTLVVHGKQDPRVPPNQGQIFYRALRAQGVPSALVWLPRTPHGPTEPGLQYETARVHKEWMDHWIRGRPLSEDLAAAVQAPTGGASAGTPVPVR